MNGVFESPRQSNRSRFCKTMRALIQSGVCKSILLQHYFKQAAINHKQIISHVYLAS